MTDGPERIDARLRALESEVADLRVELARWRDPMTRLDAWCDDLAQRLLDRIEKVEAVQALLIVASDPDGPLGEQAAEIQIAALGLPPVADRR